MKMAIVALGAGLVMAGVAQAQDGTEAFAKYCERYATAQGASSQAAFAGCACGSGVVGGQLSEREYTIMGRLVPTIEDEAATVAEMQRMLAEGYTGQEVQAVGQTMIDSAPRIERVCAYYESGRAFRTQVSLETSDGWGDLIIEDQASGPVTAVTSAGGMLSSAAARLGDAAATESDR